MEWVIAIAFMGLLAGGYAYVSHLDRKRRDGLVALANELGLEFSWQLQEADLPRFNRFELATKGRLPTTGMTMVADNGQTRMLIFDFSYTIGYGKHKRSHLFSIAMCTNLKWKMPNFSLEPESWGTKIAEFVGQTDIDIEDDPFFSKLFSIRGDDPNAIRGFLNTTRRAVLSKFPNQRLTGQLDTLLVIRKYGRLKAENVRELMSEAFKISQSMCD